MTTDERLEKLERELSRARTRFRWLVVGAGLCAMSVAVIYAFQQVTLKPRPSATEASKEVRANNFVLEDTNGKPRAVLGLAKKMPLLCLYDEREKPRATLALLADGPHIVLRDEKGNSLPIR
jgi:hypothetical protein